jgi:hypothetical protein
MVRIILYEGHKDGSATKLIKISAFVLFVANVVVYRPIRFSGPGNVGQSIETRSA